MSLIQLSAQQIATYINGIFADPNTYEMIISGSFTGTGVLSMQSGNDVGDAGYLQSRDRIYSVCRVSSATDLNAGFLKLDPEFALTSAPADVDFEIPQAGAAPRRIYKGCFNPSTGQQFIGQSGAFTSTPRNLNPDTLETSLGAAFTGVNGDFLVSASDIGTGSPGGWNSVYNGGLFFEGLTDGISGETLQTGANVYPQGLYWGNVNFGNFNGDAGFTNCWGWIDIETRRWEGMPGLNNNFGGFPDFFPAQAVTTAASFPTNVASEAPLATDSFNWYLQQFQMDEDGTFAQPKGLLMFVSRQPRPGTSSPGPADPPDRVYVRFTDFNPFNKVAVPGEPIRTHGRIRLTSRILLDRNPQLGLAGQATQSTFSLMRGLAWDPLRNRLVTNMHDPSTSGQIGDPFGIVTDSTLGFFALQVDPVVLSAPAARDVPRTNDITRFSCIVSGDLAEPVGGQEVEFELVRASTEGEVLDASTFPGTSTVDNPPIDDEVPSLPEGTLRVIADGVPLIEGTDYTVVLSTGVITWITDQSGASVVTATYEHRQTDATPAHGNLLTSSSQSDANGLVLTSVQYPDDDSLVGTIDKLRSSFP